MSVLYFVASLLASSSLAGCRRADRPTAAAPRDDFGAAVTITAPPR